MKKTFLLFPITCSLLLSCNNGSKTKIYSFTFNGEHCSLNNEAQYEEGSKIELTLTAESDDYMIPIELNDITMGGKKLIKDSDYTYNYRNGSLIIPSITGAVVVTANAVNQFHTVSFNMNNSDYIHRPIPAKQKIATNDKAIKPTPDVDFDSIVISLSSTKHIFSFWSLDKENPLPYNFNEEVASSITLYAIWDSHEVSNINFLKNNNDYPLDAKWPNSGAVIYDEKLKEPSSDAFSQSFISNDKTKSYQFSHWSKTKDGEPYNFNEPVIIGFDLYAIWKESAAYKVEFIMPNEYKAQTPSLPIPPIQYVAREKTIKQPVAKKDFYEVFVVTEGSTTYEYEFKQWEDINGDKFNFNITKVYSDINIYAKYTSRPIPFLNIK